jgi:thiol:disulfide interchange protein
MIQGMATTTLGQPRVLRPGVSASVRLGLAAGLAAVCLWAGPVGAFPLAPPEVPAGAMGADAYDGNQPTVEARLLVDGDYAVAGQPIRLGVLLTMDPGWHIYWRNSGQSGVPTETDWNITGAELGELAWPAPEVFSESDGLITTYGWEGEVLLAREAVFRKDLRGTVALAVDARFIVCKIGCIPGEISLRRTLDVVAEPTGAPRSDPDLEALFDAEAKRVPVQPASLGVEFDVLYSQSAIRPDEAFKAAIVVISCADEERECKAFSPRVTPAGGAHGSTGWTFVPDAPDSLDISVVGQRPHPFYERAALVNLEGSSWSEDPGEDQRLRGVMALEDPERRVHLVEVDVPIPRARAGAAVSAIDNPFLEPLQPAARAGPPADARAPPVSLLAALLLAFLGGVVLNAMPCVLPVLALKIFAVAELAQRDRRELAAHGAAYTSGIVVSMLALAAVVAGLRSAGMAVGWGFQFQEPAFVAAVSAVLVVFAMNLFGVFEIGFNPGVLGEVGQDTAGTRRSFFEGLLAVVLATPCSAPFLGTAVGFAFASPAPVIFAIFAAVGLGLASPYALVTLVPGWGKLVPKPGMWMLTFRKILGAALLATVVWLVWVAGRIAGDDGGLALALFLVAVAGVTWVAGHFQSLGQAQLARRVAAAASVLGIVALVAFPRGGGEPSAATGGGNAAQARTSGELDADGRWLAFERSAVDSALASGTPVFVSFTADWCITCKLNERVVLKDAEVQAEFDRLGIATFKADWTRRDEAIRQELARFGRAGVPMYLVYTPGQPGEPALLPELLTVDRVMRALSEAAAAEPRAGSADAAPLERTPAGA